MDMYQHDGESSFRFVLLGSLEGAAARELELAWRAAESVARDKEFVVDLTGLTGIDEAGLEVLSRMRHSGCRVHARQRPEVQAVADLIGIPAPKESTIGRWQRWKAVVLQHGHLLRFAVLLVAAACAISRTQPHSIHRLDGHGLPGAGAEQVIARSVGGVCLIQGSYVFREREGGRILRRDGWFVGGNDSVLEMSYSGTGFLVSSDGDVLTNRHIAEPWWADPEAQRIVAAGYRPEMKSLRAYFPGRGIKYNLKTVLTSKQADVALLQVDPVRNLPAPLVLGPPAERAAPGSRVLLIGYPAGLGPILGRLNRAQLDRVPEYLNFTEQQMTQALASKALIEPFVSFGYLSNVKGEVLTLSAQTSEGSSGSPVLNEQGEVIAIHSAALTRVAGGSLAVPVEAARELITHRGGANRSQGGSSFTRWRNPHSGR